jgi:hypothetical protein
MGKRPVVVLYLATMVAIIVGVDFAFLRNRFWEGRGAHGAPPYFGRNAVRLTPILWASAVVLLAVAPAAQAQTIEQNWAQCQNGDPGDTVINACTALINSGQGDARTRAAEYVYRGLSYESINQKDKALADYRAAEQLDPYNAGAKLGISGLTP